MSPPPTPAASLDAHWYQSSEEAALAGELRARVADRLAAPGPRPFLGPPTSAVTEEGLTPDLRAATDWQPFAPGPSDGPPDLSGLVVRLAPYGSLHPRPGVQSMFTGAARTAPPNVRWRLERVVGPSGRTRWLLSLDASILGQGITPGMVDALLGLAPRPLAAEARSARAELQATAATREHLAELWDWCRRGVAPVPSARRARLLAAVHGLHGLDGRAASAVRARLLRDASWLTGPELADLVPPTHRLPLELHVLLLRHPGADAQIADRLTAAMVDRVPADRLAIAAPAALGALADWGRAHRPAPPPDPRPAGGADPAAPPLHPLAAQRLLVRDPATWPESVVAVLGPTLSDTELLGTAARTLEQSPDAAAPWIALLSAPALAALARPQVIALLHGPSRALRLAVLSALARSPGVGASAVPVPAVVSDPAAVARPSSAPASSAPASSAPAEDPDVRVRADIAQALRAARAASAPVGRPSPWPYATATARLVARRSWTTRTSTLGLPTGEYHVARPDAQDWAARLADLRAAWARTPPDAREQAEVLDALDAVPAPVAAGVLGALLEQGPLSLTAPAIEHLVRGVAPRLRARWRVQVLVPALVGHVALAALAPAERQAVRRELLWPLVTRLAHPDAASVLAHCQAVLAGDDPELGRQLRAAVSAVPVQYRSHGSARAAPSTSTPPAAPLEARPRAQRRR